MAFSRLNLLRDFRNIIWHGEVNAVGVIIMIKIDSEVTLAFPIFCDIIIFFGAFYEVVVMLLTNILYSKIFDKDRERDRPPLMCPQTGCNLALVVAIDVEACFKELLGQDSTLEKPIYPALDDDISEYIWGQFFT